MERDNLKKYRDLWKLIHNITNEFSHDMQYAILISIIKELHSMRSDSKTSCLCSSDANILFNNIFFIDKDFSKIKDCEKFWIYFHNEVNFKLGKELYKK